MANHINLAEMERIVRAAYTDGQAALPADVAARPIVRAQMRAREVSVQLALWSALEANLETEVDIVLNTLAAMVDGFIVNMGGVEPALARAYVAHLIMTAEGRGADLSGPLTIPTEQGGRA